MGTKYRTARSHQSLCTSEEPHFPRNMRSAVRSLVLAPTPPLNPRYDRVWTELEDRRKMRTAVRSYSRPLPILLTIFHLCFVGLAAIIVTHPPEPDSGRCDKEGLSPEEWGFALNTIQAFGLRRTCAESVFCTSSTTSRPVAHDNLMMTNVTPPDQNNSDPH